MTSIAKVITRSNFLDLTTVLVRFSSYLWYKSDKMSEIFTIVSDEVKPLTIKK